MRKLLFTLLLCGVGSLAGFAVEPPADGDWVLTLEDADKKSSDPRNPFINP